MPTGTKPKNVAVIGGGITGLSAAFELTQNGHRVSLFESSGSFGGKIAEASTDGLTFPTGPDAFLARRPEVVALAQELGLETLLISPAAGSARIYRNGALHLLPPNVLGIPATTDVAATGLISPEGAQRAAAAVKDQASTLDHDESVGSLVRRQLGDEVLEFLVDPLLGGINAGDSDQLSIVSGVPQIDALRRRDPLLLNAAKQALEEAAQTAKTAGPRPVFRSIEGGLSRLVDRLVEQLKSTELCNVHVSTPATLARVGDSWQVNGQPYDEVISTIPAFAAADLVEKIDQNAASHLRAIDYSSVALTVMTLAPDTLPVDASISGVLVPRTIGLHVTAVSFASHKWPSLSVRGQQVLRVSTGRRTDDRWSQLSDEQLITQIEHDLSEIFATEVSASNALVTRWMRALPQYDVDHAQLITKLDTSLENLRGLHLTGAWRNGLGLPACVGAGRLAGSTL